MSISVIIPSLNESTHVLRAIDSVRSLADEIILSDGGSTDTTVELAESAGARVVVGTSGRGSQLRRGVEATERTQSVLLFLHADCWLSRSGADELDVLASGEQVTERLFGCFRQRIDDANWRFRILEAGNAVRATRFGLPYGDQAIFVDRATYDEVGGFDVVPLMEDVMLCDRLRKVARPRLLDGPVHLSARRWKADGVLRRTIFNQAILAAYRCGVSPQRLARWYG